MVTDVSVDLWHQLNDVLTSLTRWKEVVTQWTVSEGGGRGQDATTSLSIGHNA